MVADKRIAALLGVCMRVMPVKFIEIICQFLIDHHFGLSAYFMLDEISRSGHHISQHRIVSAAQKLKHAGLPLHARALLNRLLDEDKASAGELCEKAIIAKICGDFPDAVRLLQECVRRDPDNSFYKRELWTILPETEDVKNILTRYKGVKEFLHFAGSRLYYRIRPYRWKHDDGDQNVSEDVQLREIAPEIATEFARHRAEANQQEQIRILQLGWRERITQSARIRELTRIDVVRVRVVCDKDIAGMRVRIDGRTVAYEPAKTDARAATAAPGKKSFVFNCWMDLSAVPRGLHEIQLYFEQRDGGYITREEVIYVNPEEPSERKHFSGTTVRLDGSRTAPLDDQINSLPSALLSARRSFFSGPIRRILVARADQLGDFVLSVPAILRIKEMFPGADICCLAAPQNRELAQSLGLFSKVFHINLVYDHAARRRFATVAEQVRLRRELKEEFFDMAIDLSPSSDTRPLLRLANAQYRVGFKPEQFRWLSFGVDIQTHDDVNGKEGASHAAMISSFIEAVGGAFRHRPRTLKSGIVNWETLRKFGIRPHTPFAVLHSGARLHIKRWPAGHYIELARLTAAGGLHTVLFLEDPAAAPLLNEAGIPADRLHVITGAVAFEELDSLVSLCSVFVGNDTGPKHLAALRGAPVVSVHMGQVNWDEWGQEGDGMIVTRNVPCYGCGIEDAADCGKDLACLVHIKPGEVYEAVLSLLAAEAPPQTGWRQTRAEMR